MQARAKAARRTGDDLTGDSTLESSSEDGLFLLPWHALTFRHDADAICHQVTTPPPIQSLPIFCSMVCCTETLRLHAQQCSTYRPKLTHHISQSAVLGSSVGIHASEKACSESASLCDACGLNWPFPATSEARGLRTLKHSYCHDYYYSSGTTLSSTATTACRFFQRMPTSDGAVVVTRAVARTQH